MSRKRGKVKGIPKPSKEELLKWNNRLSKLGLSVEKGRDPRQIYVGDMNDLSFIDGFNVVNRGKSGGK